MTVARTPRDLRVRLHGVRRAISLRLRRAGCERNDISALQPGPKNLIDQRSVILIDDHAIARELRQTIGVTDAPHGGVKGLCCRNVPKTLYGRCLVGTHS